MSRNQIETDADKIAETMTPSDAVLGGDAAQEPEPAPSGDRGTVPLDRDGNPFDPSLHETDAEGAPLTNKDGSLKKRRGRRAGRNYSSMGAHAGGGQEETAGSPSQGAVQSGRVSAHMMQYLGMTIFGDEWRYRLDANTGINEELVLSKAFADYYEYKGWDDLPPGAALAVAVSAYVLPRFAMPKTRSRFQILVAKVKGAFVRWQLKRRGIDPDSVVREPEEETEAAKE